MDNQKIKFFQTIMGYNFSLSSVLVPLAVVLKEISGDLHDDSFLKSNYSRNEAALNSVKEQALKKGAKEANVSESEWKIFFFCRFLLSQMIHTAIAF